MRPALPPLPPPAPGTAALRTRPSSLAISIYPPFAYDASGGGGVATVTTSVGGGAPAGAVGLAFDTARVSIPPLDWRTGRWLGVPLPPFLRIDIVPLRLEGWLDPATGAASLDFRADFFFTAFGVYAPPAIKVSTTLTTGTAAGASLSGAGAPRDAATGAVRLAGVADVVPTGDGFLDWFLRTGEGKRSECLAVLDGELILG